MKKLFNEFKTFINKGSVMDLAVGMIIGSAFTAIVSALVKNILTPLINWIPGADNTGALQTVLRGAVCDAEGNVLTEALILDWGSVISAIVTFLCTALVLFFIIKALNKVKDAGSKVKAEAEEKLSKLRLKEEAPVKVEQVTEVIEKEAFPTEKKETTEELLKQIVLLLEKQENSRLKLGQSDKA